MLVLNVVVSNQLCGCSAESLQKYTTAVRRGSLGKPSRKKNGKKRGHCPLWANPPPKRVKRGHLLSDYRQKCVNGTRASYCGVKSPFVSDLRLILTHIVVSKDSYWLILTDIVVSKVHFWVIWDSYCGVKRLILTHIVVSKVHFWVIWDSYCGVKSPFLSDLRIR